MLYIFLGGRGDDEPQTADTLRQCHRHILRGFCRSLTIELVFAEVLTGTILHQGDIAQAEGSVGIVRIFNIGSAVGGPPLCLTVHHLGRVTASQLGTRLQSRKVSGDSRTCLRHLQGDDVEARRLRRGGQRHLIGLVSGLHTTVGEVADIGVTIGFAGLEIPGGAARGIVVVELEQSIGIQILQFHQCLIEVCTGTLLLSRHGLVPHLCHYRQVIIVLAEIIVEPIALVAVPFMAERIVMGIAEHADALVEHQFGIRLGSLPLGGLLPDGLAVAALQVETRVVGL